MDSNTADVLKIAIPVGATVLVAFFGFVGAYLVDHRRQSWEDDHRFVDDKRLSYSHLIRALRAVEAVLREYLLADELGEAVAPNSLTVATRDLYEAVGEVDMIAPDDVVNFVRTAVARPAATAARLVNGEHVTMADVDVVSDVIDDITVKLRDDLGTSRR